MLHKTVLFVLLAMAAYTGSVSSEIENIIQTCNENNATDKVEQVKILINEYINCGPKTQPDFLRLAADFNETRTVDEVAKKYCTKAAETRTCLANIETAVGLCGAKGDQKHDLLSEIVFFGHSTDYMCYEEDGRTRLAKFVDDGGIRCITSRLADIVQCDRIINPQTYTQHNVWAAYQILFRCMIDQLKACSNLAASRAEGMLDYIFNVSSSSGNTQLLSVQWSMVHGIVALMYSYYINKF